MTYRYAAPLRLLLFVSTTLLFGAPLWASPEVTLWSQGQSIASSADPHLVIGLELGQTLSVSARGFPPAAKVRLSLEIREPGEIFNLLSLEMLTDLQGRIPTTPLWWRSGIDKCACPWTRKGHPFKSYLEAESRLLTTWTSLAVRAELLPPGSMAQAEAFTQAIAAPTPQFLVVDAKRDCEAELVEVGTPLEVTPHIQPDGPFTLFWVDAEGPRRLGSPLVDLRADFPRGQVVDPEDWPVRVFPPAVGAYEVVIRPGVDLSPFYKSADRTLPDAWFAYNWPVEPGPQGVLVSEWPPVCD